MTDYELHVSVIVPTRNRAALLDENLGALLAQDFDGYEVVCVDDGSTDGTRETLERLAAAHPERLRAIRAEGVGPGRARNLGVKAARGELLLFTDDDVTAPPDWIAEMAARRRAHGCDALCGGIEPYSMAGPVERYLHYRMQTRLGPRPRALAAAPMMSFLVSRAVFDAIGGFLDEPLEAAEDWEFCMRLRRRGYRLFYDPGVAVRHRYQTDLAAAERRIRATGALGVRVNRRHGRSAIAYTAYSTLRFLMSPFWLPRHYPLDLCPLALRMEALFALERLRACGRALRGEE